MDIIEEIKSNSNNASTDILNLNSRVTQESQTTTSVNNNLFEHPEIDINKLCKGTDFKLGYCCGIFYF